VEPQRHTYDPNPNLRAPSLAERVTKSQTYVPAIKIKQVRGPRDKLDAEPHQPDVDDVLPGGAGITVSRPTTRSRRPGAAEAAGGSDDPPEHLSAAAVQAAGAALAAMREAAQTAEERAAEERAGQAKRPRCDAEAEASDAFEKRVQLGSNTRYDLLSESEQREWRKRRTDVVHRAKENLERARQQIVQAKQQTKQVSEVAAQQVSAAKALSMREAELDAAEDMLQVFTHASLKLLEAGLEDFPRLFAEAIISGALSVESLYALRLSDGAANVNRPKTTGWRHSETVKIVCALAKTRQR